MTISLVYYTRLRTLSVSNGMKRRPRVVHAAKRDWKYFTMRVRERGHRKQALGYQRCNGLVLRGASAMGGSGHRVMSYLPLYITCRKDTHSTAANTYA